MLVDYTNFGDEQAVDNLESGLLRVDSRKIFVAEDPICRTGFVTLKNSSTGNCNSIDVKGGHVSAIPSVGDERRNLNNFFAVGRGKCQGSPRFRIKASPRIK